MKLIGLRIIPIPRPPFEKIFLCLMSLSVMLLMGVYVLFGIKLSEVCCWNDKEKTLQYYWTLQYICIWSLLPAHKSIEMNAHFSTFNPLWKLIQDQSSFF